MRRLLICLFSSFSLFTAVDLRAEQAGSTAPANGSLIVPNDNRIAAGVTVKWRVRSARTDVGKFKHETNSCQLFPPGLDTKLRHLTE